MMKWWQYDPGLTASILCTHWKPRFFMMPTLSLLDGGTRGYLIARRHGPVIWTALHNEGDWWMDTYNHEPVRASDYMYPYTNPRYFIILIGTIFPLTINMCDRGRTITHLQISRFHTQAWYNYDNLRCHHWRQSWHTVSYVSNWVMEKHRDANNTDKHPCAQRVIDTRSTARFLEISSAILNAVIYLPKRN